MARCPKCTSIIRKTKDKERYCRRHGLLTSKAASLPHLHLEPSDAL